MARTRAQIEDGIHLIKRYQNRKLYSVNMSRYIIMDEIINIIKHRKEEVKVVDVSSGKDISGKVLLQVLLKREEQHAEKNKDIYELIIEKYDSIGDLL